eukprot:1178667-Prorocentrum_minimum.AAC.1
MFIKSGGNVLMPITSRMPSSHSCCSVRPVPSEAEPGPEECPLPPGGYTSSTPPYLTLRPLPILA